ncbi:MAG: aminopeptidase P family protein, partial [Acidobacteria bacterium]|nr:aminopeptidase P family protein [Acidobacteriota bacterium]
MLSRKNPFRIFIFIAVSFVAFASHAREREPLKEYAARRAKLRAQLNAPVVLFAFTGQEDASPAYVFNQEENFYYLTGHNEPGAVLLLVPDKMGDKIVDGPKEIMFLRSRDLAQERWNAPVMGPDDPGVAEKIGIERVEPFASLSTQLERLGSMFRRFYTLLPAGNAGYPHAKNWNDWLRATQPRARLESASPAINTLRMVKSESELVLLKHAIDLSAEAHVEAMKMMHPGLYEYEIASRMEYIHKRGGCETEGYAPIVGTGFNST